jgi:hypothetical protein
LLKEAALTLRRSKFILYFEFEFRKSRTIKRDSIHLPKCATKCSNSTHKLHILSPNSQQKFTSIRAVWKVRQCRTKRTSPKRTSSNRTGCGSAALNERQCRSHQTVGTRGGITYPPPQPPQRSSLDSSSTFRPRATERSSPSLLHCSLKLPLIPK